LASQRGAGEKGGQAGEIKMGIWDEISTIIVNKSVEILAVSWANEMIFI